MTKFETVQSLRGGEMQRAAVEKMTVLQEQMNKLPEQTETLAAAIEPLTEALMQLIPLMRSIDQRLTVIEASMPIDKDKKPLPIASKNSVREIREMMKELSNVQPSMFKKLLGQQ